MQLLLPAAALAQAQRAQAPPTGFESICSLTDPNGNQIPGALGVCIKQIYLFSLGFGALIALFMLVTAGYRYMSAAGNAEQVQSAKDTFETTFKGLIIIFTGFILLYLINPDLVQFTKLSLPPIPAGQTSAPPPTLVSINVLGNQSTYAVGAPVSITFSPSPAGTYTWTFDDCQGNFPSMIGVTHNVTNNPVAVPPQITGTVSSSAVSGPYDCTISATNGTISGSADFQIVIGSAQAASLPAGIQAWTGQHPYGLNWGSQAAALQAALASMITNYGIQLNVTQAYRPQAYTDHIRSVWEAYQFLQGNSAATAQGYNCSGAIWVSSAQTAGYSQAEQTWVNSEAAIHGFVGSGRTPPACRSDHELGIAMDIYPVSGSFPTGAQYTAYIQAGYDAGLCHNIPGDEPHFRLLAGSGLTQAQCTVP